jgi:hypothetical protein
MVWRTAGKVGWGGGPLILLFPLRSDEATMLKEGICDHRHERMTVQVFDLDHAVRIFAFDEPRGIHRIVRSVAVSARRAVYPNFELAPVMWLILRRVARTFVLWTLEQDRAVDPPAAGWQRMK